MPALPAHILKAIKSGPIPKVRNWRKIAGNCKTNKDLQTRLTLAEKIMFWAEQTLVVPEGSKQGQPIVLHLFQEVFIYALYDNPAGTRRAILSMGRKNSKTTTIAILLLAHLCGPASGSIHNAQIISGAMSREQAALVYQLASKMLRASPLLNKFLKTVDSSKRIVNVSKDIEYKAISAEASTAHGLSPIVAILDEIGQIVGPSSPFVDAITTAQGAYENALLIAISTNAPGDADLFSIWCDDAERSADPHTVCHVYSADDGCDLMDRAQWLQANPALGAFRSEKDLAEQIKQASRVPSMESSARLLLLNQRIALESMWLAPAIWRENNQPPDWEVFQAHGVHIGLDLSQKNDLTCACIAGKDEDGIVHIFPFAFTPLDGIDERARRDRVPYTDWVRDGFLIAVPGKTVDYEWVATYLRQELQDKGITIHSIEFDRWRITEFKASCGRVGFADWAQWHEVGQGFKDQSVRIDCFETGLLQKKLRHGSHPCLNLGASSAISVSDAAGNRKLDKSKTSNKIDALVAAVMAVYPLLSQTTPPIDVAAMIA